MGCAMDLFREIMGGRHSRQSYDGYSPMYDECYNRCDYGGGRHNRGGDVAAQIGLGAITQIFGNVLGGQIARVGYGGRNYYDDYGYGNRWGGYGNRWGGYDDRWGGYDNRWGGYDNRWGGHHRHGGGIDGGMLAAGIGSIIGGVLLGGLFNRHNRHHGGWNSHNWGQQQQRHHYRHGGHHRRR